MKVCIIGRLDARSELGCKGLIVDRMQNKRKGHKLRGYLNG